MIFKTEVHDIELLQYFKSLLPSDVSPEPDTLAFLDLRKQILFRNQSADHCFASVLETAITLQLRFCEVNPCRAVIVPCYPN